MRRWLWPLLLSVGCTSPAATPPADAHIADAETSDAQSDARSDAHSDGTDSSLPADTAAAPDTTLGADSAPAADSFATPDGQLADSETVDDVASAPDATATDATITDTPSADTTAGDTTAGDTTAGDTAAGDTTAGDTTAGDAATGPPPAPVIPLRWVSSYASESAVMIEKGLLWCLSLLGATLPAGAKAKLLVWQSATRVDLHLAHAGLPAHSLFALDKLRAILLSSGEFKVHGAIDAGRFVVLTLNSSWHYYAITDAPPTLAAFRATYGLDAKTTKQAWVINSGVAFGHRRVDIASAATHTAIAWMAAEGAGSLAKGTFKAEEFEGFDALPNGQLRFVLYGADGKLKPAADATLTEAGKPARCMWCHEGSVLPSFQTDPLHEAQLPYKEFLAARNQHNALLTAHRKANPALVHHEVADEHSYVEKLWIGFMEPSAARLALEWGWEKAAVEAALKGLPTHEEEAYHVFPKVLYDRDAVRVHAPFEAIRAPSSAWVGGAYEPKLLD